MEDKSKMQKYADIQALVQKEIETQFPKLYDQYAGKYAKAQTPLHRHNGADSPTLGNASINNFKPLPAGAAVPPSGDPGVANPTLLGQQVIYNTTDAQLNSPATAFAMPLQIINGFGTGADPNAAFHGGEAPLGVGVLFVNQSGDGVQLFFRCDVDAYTDKWYGVTLTENES